MNVKVVLGGILAYICNEWIAGIPSHRLRDWVLRLALGGLGDGSSVQMRCRFLNPRKTHFGARNVINFGCLFDGRKCEIRTGSDVSIGPEASILTLGHDPQSPEFADRGGEVVIGDHVWIGYRAIILPGVNIGEGAVIGSGSVVTRNVEPYAIVAGNPARKIGQRTKSLSYRLNYVSFLQ